MRRVTRRQFVKRLGTGVALAALGPLAGCCPARKTGDRVVVVGGGFGGSTCAKYLRRFDPDLKITLVEPATRFTTCPFSNAVVAGLRDLASITQGYAAQKARGIDVVHARVTEIDAHGKKVTLGNGKSLAYERLVLSPGIDFKWDALEGMTAAGAEKLPHAWQGGPQTTLLQKQLAAMDDGGLVIVAPPGNPYRCPPGPYERASMIAYYLKRHKPKSKILILDAKDRFSKQALFMPAWEALYPGMIEWVAGSEGGRIDEVDIGNRTLYTEFGDAHKGEVVNLIPPHTAGAIAQTAGLANNDGWCPVDQRTFESELQPGIHIIGDAAIAGAMPKSGFAANSQGKVCAAAIVSALHGIEMPEPSYVNTCYSLVAPDYGISIAAVYRYNAEKGIYRVEGSGGASPEDADAEFREKEARYAEGWYDSITYDTFG